MRNKFLSVLLLCTFVLFGLASKVFADNYTYKVYDPKVNKSYTVEMGTLGLTQKEYIFGFFYPNGKPCCVINLNTYISDGLVGGKATAFEEFLKMMNGEKYEGDSYSWKEYSKNTFYKELDSLREERAQEGKYPYGYKK